MKEHEYRNLLDNVNKGKKKEEAPEQDLFGDPVSTDIMEEYKKVFKAITASKDYIFIRGNVIGKKNNYINKVRWTGKSECCSAIYDKKTKICTACGKTTRSGKGSGGIGLNDNALKYLNSSVALLEKQYVKFNSKKTHPSFVLVGLFFVRPTDARFDFDNVETMIGDALQKSFLIKDDRAKSFIMIPMGYIIDNKNPGVLITILNHNGYFKYLISNYVC